ncbi:hypothetical protein D3C81_1986020 [compost metagenome]
MVRPLGLDALAGNRLHIHLHLTGAALLHGSRGNMLQLDRLRIEDGDHLRQIHAVLIHQRLQLLFELHFALQASVCLELLQQSQLLLQLTLSAAKFG